jgi:hypothetical protein
MDFGIRRVAAIIMAAAVLMQIAACGTAPRKQPKQLSDWNNPEDCTTDYAAAVSRLAPDKGAAPALLVDSIGSVWNCTTIPEGRYDAEVVVRWSNGWQETALDVKDMDIASGQRLVAKAYEHARGAIPASFSDVRAQPDPAHAAVENVTLGSALESKIAQAAANESVTPASAPEPQVVETPSSPASTGTTPAAASPGQATSFATKAERVLTHPASITALTAVAIVTAPIWLPMAAAQVAGEVVFAVPFYAVKAIIPEPIDGKQNWQQPARSRRLPSADCCFAWIEDGLTGEVIAGKHPFRN